MGELSPRMVNRALRGDASISLDEYTRLVAALGDPGPDVLAHGLVGEIVKRSQRGGSGGISRAAAAS
jgi:hypothetical protein